jgi:hypothetical protein
MTADTVSSQAFRAARDRHSTQMVNDRFPARTIYGFEIVDGRRHRRFPARIAVNRKFTPNRINEIFCKFSPNLLQ